MSAWQRTVAVVAAGAGMLGLLGCGGSGRPAASESGRTKSAPTAHGQGPVEHGPEFATRIAQREAAFARFGDQPSRAQRTAIFSTLRRYNGALANARFERGCSLLSRSTRARVARTQAQHGDRSEHSCVKQLAQILAATVGERNESSLFTVLDAKEARLNGSKGYIMFTTVASTREAQVLSLVQEDGNWRVTSAIALPIIYSAPTASAP